VNWAQALEKEGRAGPREPVVRETIIFNSAKKETLLFIQGGPKISDLFTIIVGGTSENGGF